MEEQLQNKKEQKYSSNQEEGFINPKLLRLGSLIPTPTDQESPIMKEASASSIDSIMASGASSIDDERSSNSTTLLDNVNSSSVHDQKKFVGGDYSASENSQKAMCASKKRKHVMIDDDTEAAASFKYSKKSPNSSQASPSSFSSPEPPSAAAVVIRNQTSSSSCPSSSGDLSFSSYFFDKDSPSSSSSHCFLTASLPTTTDVHEKPIIIVDQKDDDENGSVLAAKANTEVSSVGVHSLYDYQKDNAENSKKRKRLLIDDDRSSMKKEAAASSIRDDPSHSSSSFLHQIPHNSSQASSFAVSGSFSSPPKPPSAAAVIRNQTSSSCPSSNAAYLGRSSSFPSYFDSLQDKSAENQKSKNPSNSPSYFGKSRSLSCPCFHTASLPTTTDVHEKPIIIVDQKEDDENGSVLAAKANTEVSSVGVHSINDLSYDLINKLLSYLPAQEAAVIPILSKALYETCAVDSKLIRSWFPLWLEVDCERLSSCLTFSNINPYIEREKIMVFFIDVLLKALKALHRLIRLNLRGQGAVSSYMLSQKFGFLKHLHLFEVQIGKRRCRGIDIGCLEVLEMEHCQIPSYFVLGNGGGNLKLLIMQKCSALGGGEHIDISIELPTLLIFKYHGHLSHFDLSKSVRLTELHLQFIGTNHSLKDYWGDLNLVNGVLNSVKDRIQILHICDLCLQNVILTRHSQLLPVAFPQVTELYLTISFKKDVLTNLACLLRRSVPLLIKLFITVTQSKFTPVWSCFDSAIFNNRFEHLVLFGIKPFKGRLIETELLRHVLMKSPRLKNVELLLAYGVVYSLNEQEQQQMASIKVKKIKEDILKIPKASKEVEFVFLYEEGVKI